MVKVFRIFPTIIEVILCLLQTGLTQPVRELLERLQTLMTTPDYLTGMAFLLDVFSTMEEFSLISQQNGVLLIDIADLRSNVLRTIQGFINRPGIFLQITLEFDRISLEEFENSGRQYGTVDLSQNRASPHETKISVLRPLYIKAFVEVCMIFIHNVLR